MAAACKPLQAESPQPFVSTPSPSHEEYPVATVIEPPEVVDTAYPAVPTVFSPEPSEQAYPAPQPTSAAGPSPVPTFVLSLGELPPSAQAITITLPDGTLFQTWQFSCPQAQAARQVPVYDYQVINEFSHDPQAYTEGLEFRQGELFEGTGLYGSSSLRRVDLDSGQVQKNLALPEQYFGEGITIFGDRLYQLTWKEHTGFIYDRVTFAQTGQFSYPTEGWGLTHDSNNLIMSDGTPTLYYLDPETLQVTGSKFVTSEFGPVEQINELEMIQGEIWANIFQSTCIIRIDPETGQVTGWVDLEGIIDQVANPTAATANGIAYDIEGNRLFVTGKYWAKLFQIELKQR